MDLKKITIICGLFIFPGLSIAATINQFYLLTDNSYYSYSYDDQGVTVVDRATLTGLLQVTIDDSNFTASIDYSNVFLNGGSFRPVDTLSTDITGINSAALISGFTGEFDYVSYGNATLSPSPNLCIECGYEMTLNLAANPLVLSYYEFNAYGTGEASFELYVSQVPLPAAVWLFASGLAGLLGFANRKRILNE